MTRFERVVEILDASIGGPTVEIGVHRAFWRGLTRDQFIVKRVRGLNLVTINNGANSALVQALRGVAPFGADLPDPPPGALFSRMPASMPPVPTAEINFIATWIDDGCPEDEFTPPAITEQEAFSWRATNAPISSSRTDDIWFLDPQEGWAVNSNGQIVHTADGGDSWTVQLQANAYFRCIGMANRQRGWAGTLPLPRRIFETTDGGANWRQVTNLPTLAPSAICGLSVVSHQTVFASGTNDPERPARMMKTTDGGQTWSAWEMEPWADLLVDCYFTSDTHGWVVGGKSDGAPATRSNVKPVVLETQDGGGTWTNRVSGVEFPEGEWGWKIFFLNENVGFVSLENFTTGAILKTTDGGRTWVRLPVKDPQRNANLEGVGFIDENVGWVGGWGDIDFERLSSSATTDGGQTWSDANEIGLAINRFRFFGRPVTVGYASGVTVYKYERAALGIAAEVAATHRSLRAIPAEIFRTMGAGPICIPLGPEYQGKPVAVTIYSRFGREVLNFETKVEENSEAPSVNWDLRDAHRNSVPEGHYIVRYASSEHVSSTLLRLLPRSSAQSAP